MMPPPPPPVAHPDNGSSLLDDLDDALFAVCWLAQRQLATQLAPHGLTVPQYLTLLIVSTDGVGATMSRLAHQTHHSLATMTGIVDRLVKQQFVERRSNTEDRRKVLVFLTDKGRSQLIAAHNLRRHHLAQAINQLDEADRSDFIRLLKQFATALGLDSSSLAPMRYNEGR